ncbi:MAG: 3-oxoacyl-ACP reductase FabG [Chitinophagales bacterium]|nr:3-oxoacyl-ACP reductase FabG [Chitinophagales bacterium]MDW8273587.1 3-oxoacyl-ACP reductase FabG [Chitinophagales bacterium]
MRCVIVTGGASGIGRDACITLASQGYGIAIWDIAEKGKELAQNLLSKGYKAIFCYADTSDFNSVANAMQNTLSHFGKIYGLINNAGITRDATLINMSLNDWQKVIDVNLTGVFNCTKAAAPYLIEQKEGRIINTSSVVGIYGNYGQSNYSAAKAGLIGLTKTWAKELGKYNITVNAVAPGFIATDMINTIPQKVIDLIISKTPLARTGSISDVVAAYKFLLSDEAGFITGAVISVDGGLSL